MITKDDITIEEITSSTGDEKILIASASVRAMKRINKDCPDAVIKDELKAKVIREIYGVGSSEDLQYVMGVHKSKEEKNETAV